MYCGDVYYMARSGMNAKLVRCGSFLMDTTNICAHLSSADDLNQANELKPRTAYRRAKFSFVCSECGSLSVKNLDKISYPFVCHKCALSKAHKTESYAMNYEKTMKERYGDNYLEVRQTKCNQAIAEKYGSASEMCKLTKDAREATMKARYGVEHPSHMVDFRQKCSETRLLRHGSATYNNRDKCFETLIDKYGSVEAYYEYIGQKSNETKIQRYGTHTYNNREQAQETSLQRYGVSTPMQCKQVSDKAHHKYTYNGMNFDSSYEVAYLIWLTDHKMTFEYQPDIRFTYEYDGKTHWYNPDFCVDGQLIELKGRQFFKDKDSNKQMINPYNHRLDGLYEAKHQCMIQNQVKIIVDCSEYENYVAKTYGKDYIASFRNHKRNHGICITEK